MDDSVSWAVEIVTNVIGAPDATKQIGQLTDSLEKCVQENLLSQKSFREYNKVLDTFSNVIRAANSSIDSNAAALRALGKDSKDLELSLNDTAGAFQKLRGGGLEKMVGDFIAAKDAAKGFGGEMALVLASMEGLSRQQGAMTRLNATPFLGAGRLTNGTSGAINDRAITDDALSRAAASDAIRKQMEGRGSSTASSGALFASQIEDEARRVKQASDQLRAQMEETARIEEEFAQRRAAIGASTSSSGALYASQIDDEARARKAASDQIRARLEGDAAAASRSSELMAKSQQVATNGIKATVQEASQLARAYETAGQAARAGAHPEVAAAYEAQAKAARDLVTELEATARFAGVSRLDKVAPPKLTPLVGKVDNAEIIAASASLNQLADSGGRATESNTRLAATLARLRTGLREETVAATGAGEAMALTNARLSQKNVIGNFYPLIVAAGLFTGLGHAMLGFDATAVKAATDYQQAFASVARTTSTDGNDAALQIENIKKALIDLSTQLPVTFQDLSKIATAGNQLGIGASQIPEFTKTVAQFSTITGESAENTAKSFGALKQILGLSANEYNNLASSITLVGRKSVATEAEVLQMTTKLGAIAHVAGFSAAQTVGLGAALASLREPTERSQGALTTYTKVVDKAAATGGEKFQKFADVLHLTSSEAQNLLRTNPYGFFQKFLTGLSQIDAISKTTKLGDLGLGNIRVSEVLTRLSDNMTVVTKTQADAAAGFKGGTDLSNQYAQATNTLAARFKELQDAMANLFATIGSNPLLQVLTPVVTVLKDIVVSISKFLAAFPGFGLALTIITAMIGVFAVLRAGMIATAIATYALQGAFAKVTVAETVSNFQKLVRLMLGMRVEAVGAAAATRGLAVGQEALAASSTAVATGVKEATVAMTLFKLSIPILAITGAIALIGSIIGQTEKYHEAVSSSFNTDDIASALAKDQAHYKKTGDAIRQISTAVEVSKVGEAGWVGSLEKATGAQAALGQNTSITTSHIQHQTVAYGENAKAAIASSLANNQAFQDLFKGHKMTALQAVGFDPKQFASLLETQGAGAARKYVDSFQKEFEGKMSRFGGGSALKSGIGNLNDIIDQVDTSITDAAAKTAAFAAAAGAADSSSSGAASSVQTLADVLAREATDASNAAAAHATFAQSIQPIIDQTFAAVNAYEGQQQALYQLGQDFGTLGPNAALAGQGVQQFVASSIAAGSTAPQVADSLQELVNAMIAGGYVAGPYAKELQYLSGVIKQLGGSSDAKRADITNFVNGIAAANQNAAKQSKNLAGGASAATKALERQATAAEAAAHRAQDLADKASAAASAFRTTADYADDLNKVMQRAFDIQFGPQEASDKIATAFNDMRKNATDATTKIKDARKQIQGINTDLEGLRADNLQQNYFLGIANSFGDRVGAANIQAKIAKNNQDMADKQASKATSYKDIGDAYAQLDTATTGNTDAAIRNRATLSGLVGDYQDLITKLAASGLNQKELAKRTEEARKNFLSQAMALGFSKQQLEPYSKAMSGFITIVKQVPRKVSVEVKTNVSAAQNTMNEFWTKFKLDADAKSKAAAAKAAQNLAQKLRDGASKARQDANAELSKIGEHVTYPHIPTLRVPANKVLPPTRSSLINSSLNQDIASMGAENKYLQLLMNNGSPQQIHAEILKLQQMADKYSNDRRQAGLAFSGGGYTGPGGKYEPAGIVHKGEYVVPKYMVNQQTGLPYADALGRLIAGTRPQAGYAAGGFVNPDMMVVEPGPKFMRKLQEIVQTEVSAVIEPRAIAGANTDYLAGQRRRGSSR